MGTLRVTAASYPAAWSHMSCLGTIAVCLRKIRGGGGDDVMRAHHDRHHRWTAALCGVTRGRPDPFQYKSRVEQG